MKIVSWNVNGIRAAYEKGLRDFVASESPDILCLQETKAHREQVNEDRQLLGYAHADWSSAEKRGYSGVATFSKNIPVHVVTGIDIPDYEREGRIVISEYPQFFLYNIYFPNGGSGDARHHFKQTFLKDLKDHLGKKLKNSKPIIVVGDFNIAHREIDIHDPVRLANESGFLPEERQWMDAFLEVGFIDTFRYFHPNDEHRYSWWSYREFARRGNRGWRIDYICVSSELKSVLRSANVLSDVVGSDHCPVVLELNF